MKIFLLFKLTKFYLPFGIPVHWSSPGVKYTLEYTLDEDIINNLKLSLREELEKSYFP